MSPYGKHGTLSTSRVLRLRKRKAEKAASHLGVICSICGEPVAGKTRPLAQARMTQHWQQAHAEVYAAGGRPTLPKELETRRTR